MRGRLPAVGVAAAGTGVRVAQGCALCMLAVLLAASMLAGCDVGATGGTPAVRVRSAGVLVLDFSGSVSDDGFAQVKGRVRGLLDRLPVGVRVGVVAFSDQGGIILPATAPREATRRLLARMRPPAPTPDEPELAFGLTLWDDFVSGTTVSAGMVAGMHALDRAGIRGGTLYLVSDLIDFAADYVPVRDAVAALARRGDRLLLDQILTPGDVVSNAWWPGLDPTVVQPVGRRMRLSPATVAAVPGSRGGVRLAVLVAALALLVAAWELLLPRLRLTVGETT